MDNWLSCLMLNFRTLNTELFQPISFLNSPLTPFRGFILPDTEKKLELSLISHFFPSSGSGKVLNSYNAPLTFYRNYLYYTATSNFFKTLWYDIQFILVTFLSLLINRIFISSNKNPFHTPLPDQSSHSIAHIKLFSCSKTFNGKSWFPC